MNKIEKQTNEYLISYIGRWNDIDYQYVTWDKLSHTNIETFRENLDAKVIIAITKIEKD